MKHTKRVLSLLLAICLIVTISASAYSGSVVYPQECIPLETDPAVLQLNDRADLAVSEAAINDNIYGDSVVSALEANLDVSGRAYDSMMKSFYENQPEAQKNTDDVYTVSGITADGFPDSYAGAYINKNMDLVVLMTEDAASTTRSLAAGQRTITQVAGSDDLIFSTAPFSYSTLVSFMDKIYQYLESGRNGEDGFYVVQYALDDYNNCVIVGLASNTPVTRAAFKAIINDSDAFVFETADPNGCSPTFATLFPGCHTVSESCEISVGYRAIKNNYSTHVPTYGFITAGHGCSGEGESIYRTSGAVVGKTTSLWSNKGSVDAVFVESYEEVGTAIMFTDEFLRDGVDANLAEGYPIAKSGFKTKNTSGVITSISMGYYHKATNIQYYDLCQTDYECDPGDSGGIVYSTRTSNNWIAGICQGKDFSSEEPKSFFCKAININQKFGISLYT